MSRFIKLVPVINKKNGQITTSWPKKKMPKKLIEEINKQPSALKHILVEIKGDDWGG